MENEYSKNLGNCTARFDGSYDWHKVDEFIQKCNAYIKSENISDEKAFQDLPFLLIGTAKKWWEDVKFTVSSYQESTELIKRMFSPKKPAYQVYIEIYREKQEYPKGTEDFLKRKISLLSELKNKPDEDTAIDLVYGLLHSKIREKIPRESVFTFSDILSRVLNVEMHIEKEVLDDKIQENLKRPAKRNSIEYLDAINPKSKIIKKNTTTSTLLVNPNLAIIDCLKPEKSLMVNKSLSKEVQQSKLHNQIQCSNCDVYGHLANNCFRPTKLQLNITKVSAKSSNSVLKKQASDLCSERNNCEQITNLVQSSQLPNSTIETEMKNQTHNNNGATNIKIKKVNSPRKNKNLLCSFCHFSGHLVENCFKLKMKKSKNNQEFGFYIDSLGNPQFEKEKTIIPSHVLNMKINSESNKSNLNNTIMPATNMETQNTTKINNTNLNTNVSENNMEKSRELPLINPFLLDNNPMNFRHRCYNCRLYGHLHQHCPLPKKIITESVNDITFIKFIPPEIPPEALVASPTASILRCFSTNSLFGDCFTLSSSSRVRKKRCKFCHSRSHTFDMCKKMNLKITEDQNLAAVVEAFKISTMGKTMDTDSKVFDTLNDFQRIKRIFVECDGTKILGYFIESKDWVAKKEETFETVKKNVYSKRKCWESKKCKQKSCGNKNRKDLEEIKPNVY